MTRLDIEIVDLVLRDLPPTWGLDLGALVEQRIGSLARGEVTPQADAEVADEAQFADLVARQVWGEVRRSGALGGDRG